MIMLTRYALIASSLFLLGATFPPPHKPTFCETAPLQSGLASVYAYELQGRPTANGERFNHEGFTAAHLTLPFGSRVKVHNKTTGKDVIVTINDRGPFVDGRVIDLSDAARRALGDENERPGLYKVALYSCAQ